MNKANTSTPLITLNRTQYGLDLYGKLLWSQDIPSLIE